MHAVAARRRMSSGDDRRTSATTTSRHGSALKSLYFGFCDSALFRHALLRKLLLQLLLTVLCRMALLRKLLLHLLRAALLYDERVPANEQRLHLSLQFSDLAGHRRGGLAMLSNEALLQLLCAELRCFGSCCALGDPCVGFCGAGVGRLLRGHLYEPNPILSHDVHRIGVVPRLPLAKVGEMGGDAGLCGHFAQSSLRRSDGVRRAILDIGDVQVILLLKVGGGLNRAQVIIDSAVVLLLD